MSKRILFLLMVLPGFSGGISSAMSQDEEEDAQKWVVYEPESAKANGKHIVLISGDEEYRSEEALPMLGQILCQHHGFKCTVLFAMNPDTGEIDPNNQRNVPGIGFVAGADLVIMALRFRNLPDDDMTVIDAYLKAGKPVIGLRTSTHAFRLAGKSQFKHYSFNDGSWKGGFGQQVLGDTWINHHGDHKIQSTRGIVNVKHAEHKILNHVKDVWGDTDVYGIKNLGDDATILLFGQVLKGMNPDDEPVDDHKNKPMMPIAWLKPYCLENGKSGTAFCTTMGSSTDFANTDLRKLIVNASHFLLGMEDQLLTDPNVELVSEYKPTAYGFNGFKAGMKPADFEIK